MTGDIPSNLFGLAALGKQNEETLADYLTRRERELVQQTAAIRGMLAPKERELGDTRKAMDALGIPHGSALGDLMESARVRDPAEIGALALALDSQSPLAQSSQSPFAPLAGPDRSASDYLNENAPGEPGPIELLAKQIGKEFAGFTIKQMILSALADHFHNGATPTELRDYMKNAYRRDIDRNSISPQLARLREECMVDQLSDGKWKLSQHGFGIMKYSGTSFAGLTKESSDEEIALYIKAKGLQGRISIEAMRKQMQKS